MRRYGLGLTQSGFSRSLATAMTGCRRAGTFIAGRLWPSSCRSVLEGIPRRAVRSAAVSIARASACTRCINAMIIISRWCRSVRAAVRVGYYAACPIGRVDHQASGRSWLYAGASRGLAIVAIFPVDFIGFLKVLTWSDR